MPSLATIDLRAFLPSKDFAVSKAFYDALGFSRTWEGTGMVQFEIGNHRFFLQDGYVKAWAENAMLNLVVEDVWAWKQHIQDAKLVERFPGVKVTEPALQAVGIIMYLHDPTGVLWHIQQRV